MFIIMWLFDMYRKSKPQASKIFMVLHQTFKRHLNLATFYSTNQENNCITLTISIVILYCLFDKIKYNLNVYLYVR